jgi:hypothetical protein
MKLEADASLYCRLQKPPMEDCFEKYEEGKEGRVRELKEVP